MKVPFNTMARLASSISACLLASMIFVPGARAQVRPTHRPDVPNIDKRAAVPGDPAEVAQRQQGRDHLLQLTPSAVIEIDELFGSPEFVRALDGILTGPRGEGRAVSARAAQLFSTDDPYRAVKGFLSEHSNLYGHGPEALTDATIARDSV